MTKEQVRIRRDYVRDARNRKREQLGFMGRIINWLVEKYVKGYHLAKNPPKGGKKTPRKPRQVTLGTPTEGAIYPGKVIEKK